MALNEVTLRKLGKEEIIKLGLSNNPSLTQRYLVLTISKRICLN